MSMEVIAECLYNVLNFEIENIKVKCNTENSHVHFEG